MIISARGTILLVSTILSFGQLFGQNGYKDYFWGDIKESVEAKAGPLEECAYDHENFWGFFVAFYIQNGSFLNPLDIVVGKLSAYCNNDYDLKFLFLDLKLVAVEVYFTNGAKETINSLQTKYGKAPPKKFINRPNTINEAPVEVRAWFGVSGRIITYSNRTDVNLKYESETVSYLDPKLYKSLAMKLKSTIQNEHERRTKEHKQKLD